MPDVDIDEEVLKDLMKNMLLIRRFEEKIVELYPEQQMRCPTHLCIGEEAIAAGVCRLLNKEDNVLSTHRSHGHYLAKGGSGERLLAEIYGKSTGCSSGKGGSMHALDLGVNFMGSLPIVAGSIPIAAGTSFAAKLQKTSDVSVCFFGDAAFEQGVTHEVLNFAALHKLPFIMVCENNLYSTLTTLEDRQPSNREIYEVARGHGIATFHGDGNNVLEVYEKMQEALKLARSGKGPVFLEFSTYRWREHCGPLYDHELGFRPKDEVESWMEKCPIKAFRKHLSENNIMTNEEIEKMDDEIKQDVEKMVEFAKKSSFPPKEALYENVYSE